MMPDGTSTKLPTAGCSISGHSDTRTAAMEVAHELHDSVGTRCDLALVFATYHHRAALPEAIDTVRQTINPKTLLAVTAEAVIGGESERENGAGMSGVAMHLPGVTLSPWMTTPDDPIPLRDPHAAASRINLTNDFRAALMIGDPFTTPIARLLPALTNCGGPDRIVAIVGGMASGASQPQQNVLVLDDRVVPAGAIGVSIAGDIDIDFVVSQGCKPIGRSLVVTKSAGNQVLELGGKPATHALQELMTTITEEERVLLRKGLLIGTVIDEHKSRFGRGDFLVRSLLGVDQKRGSMVVGDQLRPGQTVQFHARDAVTAAEDLHLLLDAQVMMDPPFGGLLFSCNGRGQRLFGKPGHDAGLITERLGGMPLAGFFAAGEIGPIGGKSFLHGHTAALALFRQRGA